MSTKPKFKIDQEVIYHAGNFKYLVKDVKVFEDGRIIYTLVCNDESCDQCQEDPFKEHVEFLQEDELIDYHEWCEHDDSCKVCHG